jgi:hypothetical protein
MTLSLLRKLVLGATLSLAAAAAMAADVTLRVTVTNGTVGMGPPPGAATANPLPTLTCDSPKGTKTCDFKVPAGSTGLLRARFTSAGQSVRWGEACAYTLKDDCGLTVKADTQVTALIGATRQVTVDTTPGGRVTAGDLACVGKCTLKTLDGAPVTFVATPDVGHVFAGWVQPPSCATPAAGTAPNTCVVTPADLRGPVQARFGRTNVRPTLSLSVKSGTVTVKNDPKATTALAECKAADGQTSTCSVQVQAQTPLYLTVAAPSGPGVRPVGRLVTWGGACSGGTDSCALMADGDKAVSVQTDSALEVRLLTDVSLGSATARTSLGETCADNCTFTLPLGASMTVTAQAAPIRRFMGWGPGSPCATEKSTVCTLKATEAGAYRVMPIFK